MALGFVVARFGLLIRELSRQQLHTPTVPSGISTIFGTVLVVVGAVFLVLALLRYLRVGNAIKRGEDTWSPGLSIALIVLLVASGLALAVCLVLTA